MENEIWKPVVGFEGLYEVSSCGRVKSVGRYLERHSRTGRTFKVFWSERILPHKINDIGYPIVVLTKGGESYWRRVHRILAEAFIPNPDNLPEVDHIDNNKANFDLSNLRWVTHRQNMNNEITKENSKTSVYSDESIRKRVLSSKGNGSPTSPKTVYQYDLDGRFVMEHISLSSAAKSAGVTKDAIRIVIDKDGRSSAGYLWRTYYSESIKAGRP